MQKYKVGITFGAYELFHIGHLNLINQAKKLCDKLIVCISDDEYIRIKKGHSSSNPLKYRIEIISSLRQVDKVDIQSLAYGKKKLIRKYSPDVIFVGDDWTPKTFTGANLGVKVVYLDRTKNISSTLLRQKYFK